MFVVAASAAMPAFAGTLYRCDTADGARSYVSKRIPGAKCTVISYAKSSPAPAAPRAAAVGSTHDGEQRRRFADLRKPFRPMPSAAPRPPHPR